MNTKSISFILMLSLTTILFIGITAFSIDQDIEEPKELYISPLMQKAIDEKLDMYRNKILEKCKKQAIEDAEIYVDSLVMEELNFHANDTLTFPTKPVRPGLPEKIILNDSTGIKPIIE